MKIILLTVAKNRGAYIVAKEFKGTNFRINSVAPGYTATDLNNFQGFQTVEQAAKVIVKYATQVDDGSTGKYFKEQGENQW